MTQKILDEIEQRTSAYNKTPLAIQARLHEDLAYQKYKEATNKYMANTDPNRVWDFPNPICICANCNEHRIKLQALYKEWTNQYSKVGRSK